MDHRGCHLTQALQTQCVRAYEARPLLNRSSLPRVSHARTYTDQQYRDQPLQDGSSPAKRRNTFPNIRARSVSKLQKCRMGIDAGLGASDIPSVAARGHSSNATRELSSMLELLWLARWKLCLPSTISALESRNGGACLQEETSESQK